MKRDPAGTSERLDRIIRNTYRTLMTRGMKGCLVTSTDRETREFLRCDPAGRVPVDVRVEQHDAPGAEPRALDRRQARRGRPEQFAQRHDPLRGGVELPLLELGARHAQRRAPGLQVDDQQTDGMADLDGASTLTTT